MRNARLDEAQAGIMIAGRNINNLRYADGEGNGNSLQYSWASLVAHLVKNPPGMSETWVQSLVGIIP